MALSADRILLVTLTPPGTGNVGEIILKDLCALLPSGTIQVCVVASRPPSALTAAGAPKFLKAPPEARQSRLPGRLGGFVHAIHVRTVFAFRAHRLARAIAAEAAACGAGRVWITLNSLPLVAAAGYLADWLPIPLLSLVWDPPDHVAGQMQWDRWSRFWLDRQFGRALRASQRVAVVSENMADEYARRYGVSCSVLRHALPFRPETRGVAQGTIRIGFAGTLYDSAQLDALCEALHRSDWKIDGRPVVLRMIGNHFRFRSLTGPSCVELMGWRSTEETHRLLGECDVLYLPISFADAWSDFSRLSFPTKLSTYMTTGRPVLVHAPEQSSSAHFCVANRCGWVCSSMEPDALRTGLHEMLEPGSYARLCEGVRSTYAGELSVGVMRRQFAEFMGMGADELMPDSGALGSGEGSQ